MIWEAKIFVTLKEGVLDPQGKAVQSGLGALGFDSVKDVRVGKFIVLRLEAADLRQAHREVEAMCRRLLANPVIEDYRFDIGEVGP